MCRPSTAPTTGLDLEFGSEVGEFEEPFRTVEQHALEGREKPEGVDVDVEFIDHSSQLIDLVGSEELGFVADDGVQALATQVSLMKESVQVNARIDDDGLSGDAQAARDLPLGPIELADQDAAETSLGQVVVDLERLCRLPRAHRAEEEPELPHGGNLPAATDTVLLMAFPASPVTGRTGVHPSPTFWLVVAATVAGVVLAGGRMIDDGIAVFVLVTAGWVLSLIAHEFGHAYAAWRGGDASVVGRGYLDLDPRRYTDPMLSLGLPLLLVALGGLGLPGGAVWIDRRALRSPWTATAVSLAGPAMNVVGAAVCIIPLATGLIDTVGQPVLARGVAFLGFLQITAIVINLLPVPGLDGFGAVEPHLPPEVLSMIGPFRRYGMLALFVCLWWVEPIRRVFWDLVLSAMDLAGLDPVLVFDGYDLFRFWEVS